MVTQLKYTLRRYNVLGLLWLILLLPLSMVNAAAANVAVTNDGGFYAILSPGTIATSTGKYNFAHNQTPDNLVETLPVVSNMGGALTYSWEQSNSPVTGFTVITGASQTGYNFSGPLTQTTYFRRKVTDAQGNSEYSNTIKIMIVSVNFENVNYIREHDVLVTGITDWKVIDQLPIGQKLQTTTYSDGIGRAIQKVSKETATPADPQSSGLWGDMVQFITYDIYGRTTKQFLPYTTTADPGKLKSVTYGEQEQYYLSKYQETNPFTNNNFENNPLNRVSNSKSPGTAWANGNGNSQGYELNETADNVRILNIGYTAGATPVSNGFYPQKTLFRNRYTDENGKKVVEFINNAGHLILKKIQLDDAASTGTAGWICTYSVYDDYGRLRFVLQPEAVKFMENNNWSFASDDAQTVANEWCFRYEYDEKGRNVFKQAPGAKALQMLYDDRDRVVLMQDGNQRAKSTPEWTANIYDELDRLAITMLYKTSKTQTQLQADIAAATTSTVSVSIPSQPITDLVVSTRDQSINRYAASNKITFIADGAGGFKSTNGEKFSAVIDATAATAAMTVTSGSLKSPVTPAELNNAAVCTVLKYLFYDNYSFAGAKPFNNTFENTAAYPNGGNTQTITPTARTASMPTGSMVRILGTANFLSSTQYYDEKGRPIQNIEDNIKGGKDITTLQYHFDGRVLSTHTRHLNTGSAFNDFTVLTKNNFDKLGRITSVQKKYKGNDFKTIASYDFDDIGRLKTKHLAPGYTGTGGTELESLDYSYNIHNQLTGINKDYALKTTGKYEKWAHYFGLYLGYDNRDNKVARQELNGQVSGMIWNTMGDDAQRKYDFTYDNAGRLLKAQFGEKQKVTSEWNTDKMDLSVGGTYGNIEYDLNGNLLSMTQKGVMPGSNAAILVDDLRYTYASFSNKLLKVTDLAPAVQQSGLGDFKDGANGTANDYVYDDNGNLVIDLNKNVGTQAGVAGIRYNHLDKPDQIKIENKGTIRIVYDADGNKLQRMYIPDAANTPNATITTYIDQFLYQETIAKTTVGSATAWQKGGGDVQYINFEEGRLRIVQPIDQTNSLEALRISGSLNLQDKHGVFDYFIRDYQQNVRMILTDETHLSVGTASMEQNRSTVEEPVFGQTGGANELAVTRFPVAQIPGQTVGNGWQNTNIGSSVSRIGNQAAGKVGPNSLLKVMAGDVIDANTQYYYQQHGNTGGTDGSSTLTNILTSLTAAIIGNGSPLMDGKTGAVTTSLRADPAFPNIAAPDDGSLPTTPKAWLSVMFFDERFNFIEEGSIHERVKASDADNSNASITLAGIKVPKNGYAYIYVHNSSNEPVYFDNFKVSHTRGRIVEENHYYAFGLKIAGISSHKLEDATGKEGRVTNKDLYNDKELFDDGDLNWYDYGFRNYDPQIGRFVQVDPLTDELTPLSPYHYAYNDPINYIDQNGLLPILACPGTTSLTMFFQNIGQNLLSMAPELTTSFILNGSAALANAYLDKQQQKNQTKQAGKQSNQFTPQSQQKGIFLVFDGSEHKLRIYSNDGSENFNGATEIDMFDAFNNVTSNSNGKWEDGIYEMTDKMDSHYHGEKKSGGIKMDSEDGAYGEGGIFRANGFHETNGDKKWRDGMGIHAGRLHYTKGKASGQLRPLDTRVTEGCIRTTPEAIAGIKNAILKYGPLKRIVVKNNSQSGNSSRVNNMSFGVPSTNTPVDADNNPIIRFFNWVRKKLFGN